MADSPRNPDTEPPEAINREQDDEDAQAQTVAAPSTRCATAWARRGASTMAMRVCWQERRR